MAFITPGPPREREAWLAYLTEKHRLSRRPVSAGMAAAGELRAGTAKISITPDDIKMPVHDPCYARSLVLDVGGERIGIVAVDLATYSNERLVAACKERFGLSHLVLSSSHTHSAPGRGNGDFFEERITRVLEAAVKDMAPARISAGHRSFPQLGFNRLVVREDGHSRESWFGDDHFTSENPERIPFGPVDPEVGVIKIEDLDGRPRAIVMNYACHSDVVCQNYAISADYPGAATRKVEEAFGGGLNCLFVQGAGGNIESLIISSRRTGPDDPFQTDYSTIERVGGLLAYETIKLARSLTPAARKETTIRYMNDSLKFTGRFDEERRLRRPLLHHPDQRRHRDRHVPGRAIHPAPARLEEEGGAGAPVPVRLHLASGHLAGLRAGRQVGGAGRLRGGPVEQDDRGRLRRGRDQQAPGEHVPADRADARAARPGRFQGRPPLSSHPGATGQMSEIPARVRSRFRDRTVHQSAVLINEHRHSNSHTADAVNLNVARSGVVDRGAQIACSMLRCVGPNPPARQDTGDPTGRAVVLAPATRFRDVPEFCCWAPPLSCPNTPA